MGLQRCLYTFLYGIFPTSCRTGSTISHVEQCL